MTDRYTRKDVETAFRIFCQRLGLRIAESYNDVGGLLIDKGTGGYQVIQIVNTDGGHSAPFGWECHSARDMVRLLQFAADAVELAGKEGN